jgi:hypothetical protein
LRTEISMKTGFGSVNVGGFKEITSALVRQADRSKHLMPQWLLFVWHSELEILQTPIAKMRRMDGVLKYLSPNRLKWVLGRKAKIESSNQAKSWIWGRRGTHARVHLTRHKISDRTRERAWLRVEGGISWKVRNRVCQPFAGSVIIYLTDRVIDVDWSHERT